MNDCKLKAFSAHEWNENEKTCEWNSWSRSSTFAYTGVQKSVSFALNDLFRHILLRKISNLCFYSVPATHEIEDGSDRQKETIWTTAKTMNLST